MELLATSCYLLLGSPFFKSRLQYKRLKLTSSHLPHERDKIDTPVVGNVRS